MRGGIWLTEKHNAFIALGEVLMKLNVLPRDKYHYHFNFEPNPLIRQYSLFIEPFISDPKPL